MATATATRNTISIFERAEATAARVDRANGIIFGVKVIGRVSSNGREYTSAALQKARSMYEGIAVNVNHPDKPTRQRNVADRFGKLMNIREKPDGLYADLHYLTSHPMANPIAEAAERMPSAFGLSHNAEGRTSNHAGKMIIEEITAIRSVDIVSDPATTRGFFESMSADSISSAYDSDPDEKQDIEIPDASADSIKAAFEEKVLGIMRDRSMTTAQKLSAIKLLLGAQDDAVAALKKSTGSIGESQAFGYDAFGRRRGTDRFVREQMTFKPKTNIQTKTLTESASESKAAAWARKFR